MGDGTEPFAMEDASWIEQAMKEREEEVADCIRRGIVGLATLNDFVILAAECGVSEIVFPKTIKTAQRNIYPIIEREEIE